MFVVPPYSSLSQWSTTSVIQQAATDGTSMSQLQPGWSETLAKAGTPVLHD